MQNENKLVPDIRPEKIETMTETYTPDGGGVEQTAQYKILDAHPIISRILDKQAFIRTHAAAVWYNWLARRTVKDEIDEIKDSLFTTPLEDASLKTIDEINNYYDTVSSNMQNCTHYIRSITHTISHPVLGGGNWFLEGFKTDHEYEWQKLSVYDNTGVKTRARSKIAGVWKAWV